MKRLKCSFLLAGSLLGMVAGAVAQDKIPAGSFALVNGSPLPVQWVDQVISSNRVQSTPDARQLIQRELLVRAALSQEAIKQGLDKSPAFKAQVDMFVQNLLAERLISEHLNQKPIEESAIKADYDRQINALKDSKEYKLRTIVVADEAQAKAILASLRKGEAFDKLAREKSIDPRKENGGDQGWLLAEQLLPAVANVIVNLNKGAVTAAPIQTPTGWHVIKLEDTRAFTPAPYETAKPQIRQALQQKQRSDYIGKILGEARIQLAN